MTHLPTTDIVTVNIPEELTGSRLDQAIAKLLPDYSRSQLKDWIDNGAVLLNGKQVKAKTKVVEGDIIQVTVTKREPLRFEAQEIPLNIIHEDDDVIVVNKPVGLVVHPGSGNSDKTLLNALLHHEPALIELPRAGILHRIDKDTSGLLVIAKTENALHLLAKQLKKHDIEREYQTIVMGQFISGGKVDAPIARHPRDRKRMAVVEDGKEAITHFLVSEKYRNHTRLKVRLETGRTHQIRVHMSHIKHPIVGDMTYGGRLRIAKGMSQELINYLREYKRQALHAAKLTFTHPGTGELVTYKAPLPDDMKTLIELLREDVAQGE